MDLDSAAAEAVLNDAVEVVEAATKLDDDHHQSVDHDEIHHPTDEAGGGEANPTAPEDEVVPNDDAAGAQQEDPSTMKAETATAEHVNVEITMQPPPPPIGEEIAAAAKMEDPVPPPQQPPVEEATPTPVPQATPEENANVLIENSVEPMSRDCILGHGSAGHAMNELLHDFVRLERVFWRLQHRPIPTSHDDVKDTCQKLMAVVQKGKPLELAGLKDVPRPFLRSQGRFLTRSAENSEQFVLMEDSQAEAALSDLLLQELKKEEDDFNLDETPYKEVKEMVLDRAKEVAAAAESAEGGGAAANNNPNIVMVPDPKDAILLRRGASNADKLYESHAGNKFVFSLISQVVSTYTNSCPLRVEAALSLLQGLYDNHTSESAAESGTPNATTASNQKARFLLRNIREDESVFWSVLEPADAALFAICFVFEVYLEKEIHLQNPQQSNIVLKDATPVYVEHNTNVVVNNPTDLDVLFGRGGMTNAHPGNRRFRDIIALHRPDYIRALKMDKPHVARKIVLAIRRTGRFLKKYEDGKWRDVGDRIAAEKTSQGLRERTNAEKRQRSALREALRIRRQDMEDEDDNQNKKDDAAGGGSKSDDMAEEGPNKKQKIEATPATPAATPAHNISILNYSGTNMAVPLSLSIKDSGSATAAGKRRKSATTPSSSSGGTLELFTEGLPPNAVDEEGNILVTDFDILCGRGGLTNHHRGNKRFRDIVALHRPDYVRAPKIQKPSVARVIVKAIRNGDPPGRFLRKDEKTGKWVDIGDKKAAEKTSQALREKTNDERDKLKRDIAAFGQPGVLLPNPSSYLNNATVNAFTMAAVLPAANGESKPALLSDQKEVVASKEEGKEDHGEKLPDSDEQLPDSDEQPNTAIATANPVVEAPIPMETEPEPERDAQEASAKDAEAIVELITGDGVPTNVGVAEAAEAAVEEAVAQAEETAHTEVPMEDEAKVQAVNQPLDHAGGAEEEHKDEILLAFL